MKDKPQLFVGETCLFIANVPINRGKLNRSASTLKLTSLNSREYLVTNLNVQKYKTEAENKLNN